MEPYDGLDFDNLTLGASYEVHDHLPFSPRSPSPCAGNIMEGLRPSYNMFDVLRDLKSENDDGDGDKGDEESEAHDGDIDPLNVEGVTEHSDGGPLQGSLTEEDNGMDTTLQREEDNGLDTTLQQEEERDPEPPLTSLVDNTIAVLNVTHRYRARSTSFKNFTILTSADLPPNADCPICQDPYNDTDHVAVRPEGSACQHVFGRECLQTWLDTGARTCPTCRGDMSGALGPDSYTLPTVQQPVWRFADDLMDDFFNGSEPDLLDLSHIRLRVRPTSGREMVLGHIDRAENTRELIGSWTVRVPQRIASYGADGITVDHEVPPTHPEWRDDFMLHAFRDQMLPQGIGQPRREERPIERNEMRQERRARRAMLRSANLMERRRREHHR